MKRLPLDSTSETRAKRSKGPSVLKKSGGSYPSGWMSWLAVATHPRSGLSSLGRSSRKPRHSYAPVPGTGRRPCQPSRSGESAEACQAMFPSASPQIMFSVGAYQ